MGGGARGRTEDEFEKANMAIRYYHLPAPPLPHVIIQVILNIYGWFSNWAFGSPQRILYPTSISLSSGFTSGDFIWRSLSLILNIGRHIWDSSTVQLKQPRWKAKQTTAQPKRRRLKLQSQTSRTARSCYLALTWACVFYQGTFQNQYTDLWEAVLFLPFRMVFRY